MNNPSKIALIWDWITDVLVGAYDAIIAKIVLAFSHKPRS